VRNVDLGELSYMAPGGAWFLAVGGRLHHLALRGNSRFAMVALSPNILTLSLAVVGHKQTCRIILPHGEEFTYTSPTGPSHL